MIEDLMESEQRHRIFLDASPWGILVVDKTFHIVYVNRTFERMSGYAVGEVTGQHLHMVMPKSDHKVHEKHEKAYVLNPVDRVGNHGLNPRLLCKSGNILDVEISISPTKIEGKDFFFASIREKESLYNTVDRP